jgi:hypothetical protein
LRSRALWRSARRSDAGCCRRNWRSGPLRRSNTVLEILRTILRPDLKLPVMRGDSVYVLLPLAGRCGSAGCSAGERGVEVMFRRLLKNPWPSPHQPSRSGGPRRSLCASRRAAPLPGRGEPGALALALGAPWAQWAVFLHPAQRGGVEKTYNGPARTSGLAGKRVIPDRVQGRPNCIASSIRASAIYPRCCAEDCPRTPLSSVACMVPNAPGRGLAA